MENAAQKVKDWWEVADRTQRFVTVFGAAALILLLVLTAYVMSRPKMTPIYSGLTAQQQGDVVNALRGAGIPVEFAERGTVMVPSSRASEAEAAVAQAGAAPSTGPQGWELLNQSSFGQTSTEERERIIAAKEGELAKTIMSWQGVASAKVHWNVGDDSPFAAEKDPGSVSVNIVESGAGLSGSSGKAIARLVQNATGVEPENITVVNSFGRMLFDGAVMNDGDYGAGQKLAAEIQEARRRESDIQRTLNTAFGEGNTIAMVQVELDMDNVSIQEHKEAPSENPGVSETVTESLQGGGSSMAGGIAGTDQNLANAGTPRTSGATPGGTGSYEMTHSAVEHLRDVTNKSTVKAPGEVKGMTVQILANKKAVKDVRAVEKIANDYLGAKFQQPGFAASVTAVDFDEKAMKEAEAAGKAAASGAKMQQIISLLPVLALVIVGFLVIRALGKAASTRVPTLAALPQGGALPVQPVTMAPAVSPAIASKPATPSFIQYQGMDDMAMPQGDAGQRLASALGSGSIEDALRIIEEAPEDPEIKAIQARINVPLEQIKHMAKTKPQSVAMLLKGWMMEDGR